MTAHSLNSPAMIGGRADRRCRRAFTLVELLAVTAILGALIAIVMPALSRARTQAQTTSCLHNMRQLAMGWLLFPYDSGGQIPENYMEGCYWAQPQGSPYFYEGIQSWMVCDPWPNYLGNGGSNSCLSGIGQVWPYLHSPKTFFCPANPSSPKYLKRWHGEDPYWGFGMPGRGAVTTYMYRNGMYPLELQPTTTISFNMCVTPLKVGNPRLFNRVMLTDYWFGWPPSTEVPNPATVPHGDGGTVNLLWTDGHAAPWKLPKGILPVWGWFGGNSYSATQFGQDFYRQCPWWWVVADRSMR